jgi:hypothetical protein
MRMVVYCSLDLALEVSQAFNNSDARLGYCGLDVQPHAMSGVDLVAVTGAIEGFARHSYYLSAVSIFDDIQKALANASAGDATSISSGVVRQIDVH